MRVLQVIPSLAAVHGGPSFVLPIMERAIAAEGIVVETITTDDEGPGRRSDKGDGEAREENGVVRRYFPKQSDFYKVSMPLSRWANREVRRFDVVHIHALFSHTSTAVARIAGRAGVPYIIRPLGVLNQYGVKQRRALLKKCSLRWVERSLLRDAAAVHFTLGAERIEAKLLGIPFQAVVIPVGLESAGPPTSGSEARSVLYLSRIDPVKNLECLFAAWSRIHAAHPDWRLRIAGSGPESYLARLHERAESLGIEASVEWLGLVSGGQKARILADAGVFVLPSHSENFGIAAAEALLAGKACVFTPGVAVGAMAALRGAAVLAEGNPESLGCALANLMADGSARAALGDKARRFGQSELSAAVMGRRLRELYERVAKGTSV